MLQSTVQIESSRSSTQTIRTTFSNFLQIFVQLAFVEAMNIRIDLLEKKILFTSFADYAKYVSNATVHSSNGIKSFFYSNDQDYL